MPRITVVGPGAIGGLIATHLCQDAGHEVTVAARTPFTSLRLETPDGQIEAHPLVLTDPGQARAADWVLLATKAYDSESAAKWFAGSLNGHTQVAVLQNGVDHVERLSQWVPRDRILPVIVDCPTERLAPGRIRQRGPVTLRVPRTQSSDAFEGLFTRTGIDCKQIEDFTSMAWRKLCINAAGVVNALTLKPAGIVHDEAASALMRRIVRETAAVARAEGAKLSTRIDDEVIDIYRNQPADAINSLQADRMAGRPMEIDLRNGIVVERGARHGIPTPCNEMAVDLLKVN